MNEDIEEQIKRAEKILAECKDKSVNEETLKTFHGFLAHTLSFPCEVIGKQDLVRYVMYDIENPNDDMYGILGKLKIMGDEKKECIVPLCDLKAMDNRSLDFQLINDYGIWFVNSQF